MGLDVHPSILLINLRLGIRNGYGPTYICTQNIHGIVIRINTCATQHRGTSYYYLVSETELHSVQNLDDE